MRRREFITIIGGAAAWPLVARAQQEERVRRLGVLTGGPNDASFRSDFTVFQKALQHLGWIEGHNIEFNVRSGDNNAQRVTTEAKECVLSPMSYLPVHLTLSFPYALRPARFP